MTSARAMLLASIALLGVGCGPITPAPDDAVAVARTLAYVHDVRTDLCFAVVSSRTYGGWLTRSIANVPCTAAVMRAVSRGGASQ